MKAKTFVALAAMCSLMLVSCKKNEPQQNEPQNDEPKSFEPQYVDLGLASGTLWATCNVGATKPEEYGDYFAWGETISKDSYDWNTYIYCTPDTLLTKYCNKSDWGKDGFTDGKMVLEAEDDAATANWGSDWRTPTYDEFDELISCDYTLITQNGVYGCKFTGPNGNSIFIPAAGNYYKDKLENEGKAFKCWSGTLYEGDPYYAYTLFRRYDIPDTGYGYRFYGNTVRAVRK